MDERTLQEVMTPNPSAEGSHEHDHGTHQHEQQQQQQMCCDGSGRTAEEHRAASEDGKCCSDP
jgi:hypothetical protein